ncbi:unnamed protein product [Schistosoma rodhaini]|uniref:GCF C-terminal domain-containing protein n=3 Tax=Schistosoma rodhaini TaxID=6188 RepID=A0AA85EIS7_9TREM|nr:unnamed protein product [Schistosoma rodhaini]
MCSLFMKKVRRNYRSKAGDSDEEQSQESESLYDEAVKEITSQSKPDVPSIKKNKSVLSFEDDLDPDDGDTFKVKKSSMSRKITKQTKESRKKKTHENDGLKIVGDFHKNLVSYDESSPDPEENLENLRKELLNLAEDETTPEVVPSVKSEPSNVNSMIKQGVIPDAATIHLARKQREKAKSLIESSDHSPTYYSSNKNDGRRLVREDDDDDELNDDEDASDMTTVSFSNSASEIRPVFIVSKDRETCSKRAVIGARLNRREEELKCIREDFMAAEHGSDRDSDQEIEWERQQLQKAIINQNPAVLEAIQPILGTEDSNNTTTLADSTILGGLSVTDITLPKLKDNLQEKYDKLNQSLTMHKTSLEEAKRDLERGKIVIADAREKLPNLAKQFMFYQEMKDYIDDLISCFNEKMSKIEYLEKRSIIIFRERYDKLVERRRMDMKDMADTVSQPTISSTCASRTPEEVKLFEARRKRCAERESRRIRRQRARELQNPNVIQVHVDGTSTDDEEPQAAIVKRSADIDALLVDANALFEDVIEEFCELPLILERFIEWRNKYPESYQQAYISLCLPQLFSPIIRIQLIGWNPLNNHANPIEEMKWFQDLLDFCNLPLVDNNKNAKSTPLNNNKTDKSNNNNNENKNGSNHNANNFDKTSGNLDDDLRIIPKSIEKIVLQRINELVSASWDPLSEKQSLQLVNLMRNLCSTYPTICIGSRPTEKLFTSIVKRIENTIQEDIFIPLYSKTLMQHRQGPAFIFFERQFNMGLKLLKNILLWINLLSMDTLKHISLTCLINRYLLVGLACLLSVVTLKSNEEKSNTPMNSSFPIGLSIDQSGSLAFRDAVQKLKSIVDLLPREWLKSSITSVKQDDDHNNNKDDDDHDHDESSKQTSLTVVSDPLSQIKRFLTQLLENIPPTRMYSDINVGQADIQIIERECMGTLLQLRDLLKN